MRQRQLAAVALAGVFALAGAHPAKAEQKFNLTVSPAVVKVTNGARHFAETIVVANHGSVPLRVTARPQRLSNGSANSGCAGSPARWAQISPAAFRLPPGSARRERFTIHAPAVPAGTVLDVAAVFAASPASSGTLRLGGAVGSRVVMTPGSSGDVAVPKCGHAAASASTGRGGLPWEAPVLLGCVLAAALLAAWGLVLRRRRMRLARSYMP